MIVKTLHRLLIGILFVLLASAAHSEVIRLHVPILEDSPKQHLYFHELLNTVITAAGHTPELTVEQMPQIRIKNELDHGLISIFWMVASAERNQTYLPIEVGLTNGLIGKRILFIRQGDQHLYDTVTTLEDFRKLNVVGGMGERWFDVQVWKRNNLLYKEQDGNWKAIFKKIPHGRDFDYFSRGVNEILDEVKQYPDLAIEKRLVLIYDRDFRFYLSKEGKNAGKPYYDLLSQAFQQAKESGLIEKLVQKYWGEDLETLNYNQRIKIYLDTPR